MRRLVSARSATVGSGALSIAATVTLAALPKCPACITATSAILATVGLGASELELARIAFLVVLAGSVALLVARSRCSRACRRAFPRGSGRAASVVPGRPSSRGRTAIHALASRWRTAGSGTLAARDPTAASPRMSGPQDL